jgi:hypothetical protein
MRAYTFTMLDVPRMLHRLCLVACVLAGLGTVRGARAQDNPSNMHDSLRSYLWLSASGTLLSASLASVYALKIGAIYDEAQLVPGVSPERVILRDRARHAETTADVFFTATGALAITTGVLLWLMLHEEPPAPTAAISGVTPLVSPRGAGVAWRGTLP